MAFPEAFLDEIVNRNDIAEIIGGYVHFTSKSGNNMKGLCPFHSEKTPSFSVSVDKQMYHCFGCGKGGGVINFIMEIEKLSFPDAVHVLAKRAGLTVPDDTVPKETHSKRARILELNSDAARFFYSVLSSPQGKAARDYIIKRDISKAMVTRFGLGAAPDSWNALFDAMTKMGYTQTELIDAGLAKMSQKESHSVYDTFRNRLMFPVIDVRGSVIGFSGRILGDGEPKYLNSPDTLVFDKSRNLFALNLAKKTKADMLILTEGNIDVVALHQAGFDSAVASLGTSLTEEQARLMSRYSKAVVVAYDSDDAGIKASQRAIGLLEKTGLDVRVLRMQGAKDPDEFIKKFGRDAFTILLEQSENHIEYRLLSIKAKYSLDNDEGRLNYLAEATEMLSKIDNALEREVFGTKVAEAAGVTFEAVKNEIGKAFKRRIVAAKKKNDIKEHNAAANIQPRDKSLRYDHPFSATAEEGIIRTLIVDNELFRVVEELKIDEDDFTSPFLLKLFYLMKRRYHAQTEITPASLLTELSNEEASQFSRLIEKPASISNGARGIRENIDVIRTRNIVKKAQEGQNDESETLKYITKLSQEKLKKKTDNDPRVD